MSSATPTPGINLAVIAGSLSRPPEARQLPSGDELVTLEVTVRAGDAPAATVPVAWFSPRPEAHTWRTGQPVVVLGRVNRRFFRAGGATQSRVEVVAASVLPRSRRAAIAKTTRRALDHAQSALVG